MIVRSRLLPVSGVPRVVAVPGLGLSVDVPSHTLARLQPAVASAALALPGFGEPAWPAAELAPSELAPSELAPSALARRLLVRLDELGVPPVVLMGHSASCQIVAHAAALAPSRVTGLVLVGPTTDPRGRAWTALASRWLRTGLHERPGQIPTLVRDYPSTGFAAMARAMDAARRERIERTLAAVRGPVLVVRGRHDRIAPADWVAALAAVAPDGRATTLPAGAHMVPITHPALLATRLLEFVG